MNEPLHERVEREDLVTFVNACFAATGQREHHEAPESAVSLGFLHAYILGNYRRLYARILGSGINHFSAAEIIVRLLAAGAPEDPGDRREEGELIRAALAKLPPQRALRLLARLRRLRVNNRRARAVARDYLAGRRAPAFDAVKYRKKVRAIAVHAHLRLSDERAQFLFRGWKQRRYATPLFEAFRAAHFSESAIYQLPFSIAEGFAERAGLDRDRFLRRARPSMTAVELARLESSASRAGLAWDADLGRLELTKLSLRILALPLESRRAQAERLEAALDQAVKRILGRTPKRLDRVAAVLDRSYSASGSEEKRRRPLGVALAAHRLLGACAKRYSAHWTHPVERDLLLTARGATDLATPLLAALRTEPELVVIVSDGYENAPPLGAAEVARVFRARLDPEHRTSIVHVNPALALGGHAPKGLGPAIPTVGVRGAEDLLTALGFARFADGSEPLRALERHLAAGARALVNGES